MAINHGSLSANLTPRGVVGGRVQNSVLAYENDYENLINKPSINNTELNGDLSLEDLGIVNNVQPDWEQTDTEADDYINNKPDIPENLSDLNDDADHRTVSDTEKTTWNNKSDFSGSYNDLTDKPVIPDAQIQSDWNQNDNTKADYIKNKLTGARLYVTKEPCPMCAGAIVLARRDAVVWGVSDPKRGGGTVFRIFDHPGVNHHPAVVEGVCEAESKALLQDFFRARRRADFLV